LLDLFKKAKKQGAFPAPAVKYHNR